MTKLVFEKKPLRSSISNKLIECFSKMSNFSNPTDEQQVLEYVQLCKTYSNIIQIKPLPLLFTDTQTINAHIKALTENLRKLANKETLAATKELIKTIQQVQPKAFEITEQELTIQFHDAIKTLTNCLGNEALENLSEEKVKELNDAIKNVISTITASSKLLKDKINGFKQNFHNAITQYVKNLYEKSKPSFYCSAIYLICALDKADTLDVFQNIKRNLASNLANIQPNLLKDLRISSQNKDTKDVVEKITSIYECYDELLNLNFVKQDDKLYQNILRHFKDFFGNLLQTKQNKEGGVLSIWQSLAEKYCAKYNTKENANQKNSSLQNLCIQQKEKIRILIVEDNGINAKYLTFLLPKIIIPTPNITVAENGLIGLEKFIEANNNKTPYDVIFMDLQMPVMDGYECHEQIRKHEKEKNNKSTPPVPIIVQSSNAGTKEEDKKLLEDGFKPPFLAKPYTKEKVLDTIKKHLENKENTNKNDTKQLNSSAQTTTTTDNQKPKNLVDLSNNSKHDTQQANGSDNSTPTLQIPEEKQQETSQHQDQNIIKSSETTNNQAQTTPKSTTYFRDFCKHVTNFFSPANTSQTPSQGTSTQQGNQSFAEALLALPRGM